MKVMNKIRTFICWLLIGVIGSLSISAMIVSGSFNLDNFYDVGEVSEIYQSKLHSNSYNLESLGDGSMVILGDYAYAIFQVYENEWNYWDIEVSDLNVEQMNWQVIFCNQKDKQLMRCSYDLKKGSNIIDFPDLSFSYVAVIIENQPDVVYHLSNMKFCEKYPIHNGKQLLQWFTVIMLAYIALAWGGCRIIHKKWKREDLAEKHIILDGYQRILKYISDQIPAFGERFSDRKKHFIRIVCFLLWMTYIIWMVDSKLRYKLHVLNFGLSILLVLVIAIISIGCETKMRQWNYKVMAPWFALWVIACISDFIVPKRWSYLGYTFLLVWGLLFFLWHNMKNPMDILKDIVIAIQIHFAGAVLYCFICRPQYENISYLGVNDNANMFGFYLITVVAAWLAIADNLFVSGLRKWKGNAWKIILLAIEADLLIFFLWKAQCRGSFIVVFVLTCVFLIKRISERKQKGERLARAGIIVMTLLMLFPIWYASDWITWNVPQKLGTVKVHQADSYKPKLSSSLKNPLTMEVYASNKVISKLQSGTLDELLSGRVTIWKGYLREMNLWGHKNVVNINGKACFAHNSIIAIMYRYGVFAGIPYILMWIGIVESAVQYMSRKKSGGKVFGYGFFPFALCIGYIVLSLNDALEQPWRDSIWLLTYFVIGIFMVKRDEEMA